MLASLASRHRPALVKLLEGTLELTKDEVEVALELVDDVLEERDPSYRFLLWAPQDRVEGYVCFGATPMTQACFDLYWLVVAEESRRTGIASRLVRAAEEAIRTSGGGIVRVETAGTEAYRPARAFYERLGYVTAGRIVDFYAPGNDLFILTKHLSLSSSTSRSPS